MRNTGRLPIDVLRAYAEVRSIHGLAAVAGVTPRSVVRWRRDGSIPWRHADVVACRLGLHPANIWPELW